MKAARFEYARPATMPQALELLAHHGNDGAPLAGGQSLMPMMNLRLATPAVLVDIGRIPGLADIALAGDRLVIGAMARHADMLASSLVREHAPLLSSALVHVAHAAIRNRGTLGGSLSLADPAAELPACMVCLDAEIRLISVRGERVVAAADFFKGTYATNRAPDELLVSVAVPRLQSGWRFSFDEFARRRGDFAIAGLAFGAKLAAGRIEQCRVAFCGVEDAPRRLQGASLDEVRETATRELRPSSSVDAPAAYRVRLALALLDRAGAALVSAA
ncbi:MAG: xanthine dehydrogenase family protein subunit M [Reyranella sp.]|nr:xanthine dehydrogenase family protein subunit M [Reyranella sp.]